MSGFRARTDIKYYTRELHELFAQTEYAVTGKAIARHDVDAPILLIDGEGLRRACRCAQTYLAAAGAVLVTRSLYRAQRANTDVRFARTME